MTKRHVPKAPTVEQRAYAHTISIHCPNITEAEMQVRCDLARIRDEAAVGMSRGSDHLLGVLSDVNRMASLAVVSGEPMSKLIRLRGSLQLLIDGARLVQAVLR